MVDLQRTDIQQTDLGILPRRGLRESREVPRQDVLVVMSLHGAHFNAQDSLALGWQGFDDVAFQATQHHALKLLVKVFDFGLLINVG